MPGINRSNGIFTAFLNRDDDVNTYQSDRIGNSITSNLRLEHLDNLNESSLTCVGHTIDDDRVNRTIPITVSGEW